MLMKPKKLKHPQLIGWREWIGLPEFGMVRLKAKIDTGARTSALHATHIKVRAVAGGGHEVDFRIPGGPGVGTHQCTAKLVDQRNIKNTSGEAEPRLVVQTRLVLGHRSWPIEISLANREAMTFDLILGRTAIRRHHILVDPGRSFLLTPPKHSTLMPQASTEL